MEHIAPHADQVGRMGPGLPMNFSFLEELLKPGSTKYLSSGLLVNFPLLGELLMPGSSNFPGLLMKLGILVTSFLPTDGG